MLQATAVQTVTSHTGHIASGDNTTVHNHLAASHRWTIPPHCENDRLWLLAAHAVAHQHDGDGFPTHPWTGHTCIAGPVCAFWYEHTPHEDCTGCGHASCEAVIRAWCEECAVTSLLADEVECPVHGTTWITGGTVSEAHLACGHAHDTWTGEVY